MNTNDKLHFIGTVKKADEEEAKIRIFPRYCCGLKGIKDFSHLIILYWFHLRATEKERQTLLVFPRRHTVNVEKGVLPVDGRKVFLN